MTSQPEDLSQPASGIQQPEMTSQPEDISRAREQQPEIASQPVCFSQCPGAAALKKGGGAMDYWAELENLPADEYARRFKHFTPAQLRQSLAARNLDVCCEDPATLAAAATIAVRAANTAFPGPPSPQSRRPHPAAAVAP